MGFNYGYRGTRCRWWKRFDLQYCDAGMSEGADCCHERVLRLGMVLQSKGFSNPLRNQSLVNNMMKYVVNHRRQSRRRWMVG